jgi:integrase/recombinase XerD
MRQPALRVIPEVPPDAAAPRADALEKEWREQVEAFVRYRKAQGKAFRTRELDRFQLGRLVAWATHEGEALATFGEEQAVELVTGTDGELTPRGVNMLLQACCLFGDFLTSREVWESNPFRQIARRREIKGRQPKGLTKEELQPLLRAPDLKTAKGLRDFLAMYLMAFVGLRVGEVCNLRASDVELDRARLVIRGETAKTRVERTPWLPHKRDAQGRREVLPEFTKPLEKWLLVRAQFGLGRDDVLFCCMSRNPTHREQGLPLVPPMLQLALLRYGRQAGIARRVHPHQLRHTAGYLMGRGGLTGRPMSVSEIQEQLGHTSLSMALYYSRGTEDDTGDSYAATRITEVVEIPTRERPKVIAPTDVLGLLKAAGVDADKLAKVQEALED